MHWRHVACGAVGTCLVPARGVRSLFVCSSVCERKTLSRVPVCARVVHTQSGVCVTTRCSRERGDQKRQFIAALGGREGVPAWLTMGPTPHARAPARLLCRR